MMVWNMQTCQKKIEIGLYRHVGLSIFRNKSGTQFETKKKLKRLFKEYDSEIATESNLKIVNYLRVTLNLKDHNTEHTFRTQSPAEYYQI